MIEVPSGRYIVEFLATRPEFVGVGKATAVRLWERFGQNLYAILGDGDIDRLSELLDRNQAAIVIEAWRNQQALADCVVFFDEHGIEIGISRKAIDFWGIEAVQKMRDNPYRLLTVCTWPQVDRVATALGIRNDDPRRLVAAVESVLYDRLDRKHTWCDGSLMRGLVAKRLGTAVEHASAAVELAVADGAAIPIEGGFQPAGAAYMERFIEARIRGHLRKLSDRDLFLDGIRTEDVASFLAGLGPSASLTVEQQKAVEMVMQNPFSLLIGGAGVGKTTTLRAINAAAKHFGMNVYQLAIAGRAAGRIAEATQQPAQTVASWLKGLSDGRIELGRHTLVVVDEASMLDLPTLYRILFYLPTEARCLLVGDTAQLPPIGFGLTLHSLVLDERIAKAVLTQIFRASKASGIPQVSLSIRNGHVPELLAYQNGSLGCSFMECSEAGIIGSIEDIVQDLRHEEVQIVASVYAGTAGIDTINAYFHDLRKRAGLNSMHGFAEGDPCIWTVNDYDRHLWNGSMGTVAAFDGDSVVTMFDGKCHRVGPSEIQKLSLAYCISVHKAQGSQFKNVVLPVLPTANMDRAMIYTAVTRATDRIILVGSKAGFSQGIQRYPRSLRREVALMLRSADTADCAV
ncbi:AAA family ATPase [Agrobacterium sp. RAC06]|uniref:AAA family ATPase n=1 Tax=Agrobacterium sp. RAC06 TaxID=1842536 RepID=UPI00083DA31B|nr:AAA family ATPase [Agrobacterium sp. RAC06]AOG08789.1 phoH-like family protein [Agrobacterium sp. RAC06]